MNIQGLTAYIVAAWLTLAFGSVSAAEYVNDFHCSLKEGKTMQHLMAAHKEWMTAARENDFDAPYRVEVLVPIFNEKFTSGATYFIWRGFLRHGEDLGRVNDWFFEKPQLGANLAAVMDCEKSSLWAVVPTEFTE